MQFSGLCRLYSFVSLLASATALAAAFPRNEAVMPRMQQSALTILPSRRSGSHCELERPWPGAIRTIFHNTVTSATRLFKSIALDTNDSYSFTFTEPGTYEYFCSLRGCPALC
jgi:hypothetical protein